jgi:hypothetical protein
VTNRRAPSRWPVTCSTKSHTADACQEQDTPHTASSIQVQVPHPATEPCIQPLNLDRVAAWGLGPGRLAVGVVRCQRSVASLGLKGADCLCALVSVIWKGTVTPAHSCLPGRSRWQFRGPTHPP